MSTLAIFPWVSLPAPLELGRFQLVPYRTGTSLQPEPRIIDALLGAFQEPGGRPVESAVLVRVPGRALTADLTPDEVASAHLLGDAVAFGALARRSFFDPRAHVSGAQLAFVLRRFTGSDPRALQVAVRRRDGAVWVAHEGAFRTTRPPQARPRAALELDPTTVSALLDALAAPGGADLRDAVAAFLAASADAGGGSAQELAWLVTAFERLLGAPPGGELPRRLIALVGDFTARAREPRRLGTLRRREAAAERERAPSASILEAWARDLLRAREGRSGSGRGGAYWSPEAHLLLGAHVFPAAVLVRLAAAGLRPLADADRKALLACPYLTSFRSPFARRRSLVARDPHLWHRGLEAAGRQLARLQLQEALQRAGMGA